MPPEIRQHLRVTDVNDVAVVGFEGMNLVFLAKDVQATSEELSRLVDEQGRTKILLNLKDIEYLSSSMLVKLIGLKKKVEEAHGKLKLCCLTPVVRDSFRVSKLEQLFEIFDDEADALARF